MKVRLLNLEILFGKNMTGFLSFEYTQYLGYCYSIVTFLIFQLEVPVCAYNCQEKCIRVIQITNFS